MFNDSIVYFYNNYHNGDIHYSKEFVREIMSKIGLKHYYIHNNDKSILKDFSIEQIKSQTPADNLSVSKNKNNDIFINTWIGQNGAKYLLHDCSLKSNYLMYSDIYKTLGLEIQPIGYYIPQVDFDKINWSSPICSARKSNIDLFLQGKKCILICNNDVWSGQSPNFDFDPIVDHISNNFKDITFILTNKTNISKENVTNVSNIVGFDKNLVEISYISTKTDIIIGRASGPFCFTHIQENMSNSNKIFVSFCAKENEGKWVPDSESVAKQYWFNSFDKNDIINKIENIIKNKYNK